jgi:hypothetical protein
MAYGFINKSLIRYLIELLVEFHPDMTQRQREESLPFCIEAITLVGYIYVGLLSLLGWILL